jgi:hydrogenase-4 membrane subunit HyfE
MNGQKKPKRFVSILITVAAVFSLITSLLMVAKENYSSGLLTLQLFTTLLLAIAAIVNWYQYSKQYVEFEVEKRLKEQSGN